MDDPVENDPLSDAEGNATAVRTPEPEVVDGLASTVGQQPADALALAAADVHPPIDHDELVRFDPIWCLFWGKYVRSAQLDIWIPYLRRSRHRYLVMASEDRFKAADLAKIVALPDVMVVAPFEQAIDWLRPLRRFRGFLYIGSQPENFRTVNHLGRKAHVYIGHGESGKNTSGYRTGSLYDAVLVASYGAVARFPPVVQRFVWGGAMAIGTALVEGVDKDVWTTLRPVRTILYAPTWESSTSEATTPRSMRWRPSWPGFCRRSPSEASRSSSGSSGHRPPTVRLARHQ